MTRWLSVLVLFACLVPAPQARAAAGKRKSLFLGVTGGEGFSQKQLGTIESLVLDALQRDPKLEVIGKADLAALLGVEQQKQALGCDESSSCMAEIAGATGAELVFSGDVGKLGTLIVVSLRVLDAQKAKVLARAKRQVKAEEELPAAIDELTKETAAVMRGEPIPAPAPTTQEPESSLSVRVIPEIGLDAYLADSYASMAVGAEVVVSWDDFLVIPRLSHVLGTTSEQSITKGAVELGWLFDLHKVVHFFSPGATVPQAGGVRFRLGVATGPGLAFWHARGGLESAVDPMWTGRLLGLAEIGRFDIELAVGSALEFDKTNGQPLQVAVGAGWRL